MAVVPTNTASRQPRRSADVGATAAAAARCHDLTGLRLLIDPGHGGWDSGQAGMEASWTLAVATELLRQCRAMGAEALATRQDDTFVPRTLRSALACEWKPCLMVSVHLGEPGSRSSATVRFGAPWWRRRARVLGHRILEALDETIPVCALSWAGLRQGRCACPRVPWRAIPLLMIVHPPANDTLAGALTPARWAEGMARGIVRFWREDEGSGAVAADPKASLAQPVPAAPEPEGAAGASRTPIAPEGGPATGTMGNSADNSPDNSAPGPAGGAGSSPARRPAARRSKRQVMPLVVGRPQRFELTRAGGMRGIRGTGPGAQTGGQAGAETGGHTTPKRP